MTTKLLGRVYIRGDVIALDIKIQRGQQTQHQTDCSIRKSKLNNMQCHLDPLTTQQGN